MLLKRLALFGGCALTLAACGDPAGQGIATDADSDVDALAQYKADLDYLRQLADKSPTPYVILDLADDAQYRALLYRLDSAGKTRDNSPDLYASLDRGRAAALKASQAGEKTVEQPPEGFSHLITHVLSDTSDTRHIRTGAYMTGRGGSDYSYLDIAMTDEKGNTLADLALEEQFEEGTEVIAGTDGMTSDSSGRLCIVADSFGITEVDDLQYPSFSSVTSCVRKPGTLLEPSDKDLSYAPSDGIARVCLNRSWLYDAYDCEYTMDNTGGHILLPMKGEMEFGSKIKTLKKAYAELSLPSNGGSCHPVLDFLKEIILDGSTVRWDIPRADFGGNCFAHQAQVHINIVIQVTVDVSGTEVDGLGTISSQPAGGGPGGQIGPPVDPLSFASSCLAEGTLIRTADHGLRPIETIDQDAQILSSRDGLVLSTTDISIGIEDIPMVRLEDDRGHRLLLTEGHPVVTALGIMKAGDLKLGDQIHTESGLGVLVRVDRELYDGKVYNLKLGTAAERRYIGNDDTTMFANGILVGDGRIQADIEFDDLHRGVRSPKQKWYRDYQNSRARRR